MLDFTLTINNRQTKNLLFTLLFRFSLDLLYVFYLNKEFDYLGFPLEYSNSKNIISILVLIFFSYFIPKRVNNVSSIAISTLFVLLYIPIGTFWVYSNASTEWFFTTSIFWLVFCLVVKSKFQFIKLPQVRGYSDKQYFLIISLVTLIGLIIITTNAKWTFNLDLFAVYEIRASKPMEEVPFSGYFVGWVNLLLRFILIYSVVKFLPKLNIVVILSMLFFVALFSVSGHKSMFFTPLLVIGGYFLLRTGNFYQNFLLIIILIFAVGSFNYFFFNDGKVLTLAMRRVFMIPAQLSFYYHDFFDGNPIFLSNSIFSRFIDYPFDKPVPFIIAESYFGKENMSANNGVIADGYSHFGFVGVIIWSVLMGLLVKFCDMLIKNKPILIFLPLYLIGIRIWVNGAFLTTIFTHGLWLLMLLSYLYPSNKSTK